MTQENPTSVLVMGDSFVGIARDYFKAPNATVKMPKSIALHFAYDKMTRSNGKLLTVPDVATVLPHLVARKQPILVVLSVGGNDLASYDRMSEDVADDLVAAAHAAIQAGARRVVLMAALPRVGIAFLNKHSRFRKAIRRRQMSFTEASNIYRERVAAFNDRLFFKTRNERDIIFQHVLGLYDPDVATAALGYDGVHLSPRGMLKWCISLKTRIIVQLPVARGFRRDRRLLRRV